MANRLSRRVMDYDSRYRNGGVPQYQGQTYSGVGDDVGPLIQQQREEAAAERAEKKKGKKVALTTPTK